MTERHTTSACVDPARRWAIDLGREFILATTEVRQPRAAAWVRTTTTVAIRREDWAGFKAAVDQLVDEAGR